MTASRAAEVTVPGIGAQWRARLFDQSALRGAFQSASQSGRSRILELIDQRHMAAVEPGCIGTIRDFAQELNGKLRRKLLI